MTPIDLDAARAAYDADGCWLSPVLFDADEVDRFRAATARVVAGELTFHGSGPNTSDRLRRSLAIHLVDGAVTAVSLEGFWQHYNLALFQERGGRLGEAYRFDDLCPLVAVDQTDRR